MKKIISFVLLAAMLVTLFVPATLAADAVALVAADAEVMEGATTLSTEISLASNPASLTEFGGVIFWAADAGVADVTITFDEAAYDAANTGTGSILAGNNRNMKANTAPFGADSADYMACTVDFLANSGISGDGAVATVTFTFDEAPAAGSTFKFSVGTLYADEEEVAADADEATFTIAKDPNIGKYDDPTLFLVPESESIVPGTTTLKIDARLDANPGVWGGTYALVYPGDWTLVSDTIGGVYPASGYDPGLYDVPCADKLGYLKDMLNSFPTTPTDDTNFITALLTLDDPYAVNYNNGIIVSYVFNVPSTMKTGDSADFFIIYDKDGGFIRANEDNTNEWITFDVVNATVTMKCEHANTTIDHKDPTCGEPGYSNIVCTDCAEIINSTVIPATGEHTFVDETIDPTCTKAGSTHKKCTVCGTITDETVIEALGHDLEKTETVAPTCTAKGYDVYACKRCDYTEKQNETDMVPHTAGTPVVVDATCTEDGSSTVKCTVCGNVISETVIEALGHDWKVETVVEATCEAKGYTVYKCSRCPETKQDDFVDALGHKMTEDETQYVAPTCTTAGKHVYVCDNKCGKTTEEPIAALGHAWDGGVVTEPTCTDKGYTTYTCSRCGETKVENYTDALGHDFVLDEENSVEATCTEDGVNAYKCSRCDETKTEEVKALDHDWDEGVVTKEATETETGVKTYTCKRCQETKTEELPKVEPEKKPEPEKKDEPGKPTPVSPVTGDNMMFIIIALVVVVLASAAVIVIRRRKENN